MKEEEKRVKLAICDEILVFDEGRIVQSGRHEDLLKDSENVYASLWEEQASYYVS